MAPRAAASVLLLAVVLAPLALPFAGPAAGQPAAPPPAGPSQPLFEPLPAELRALGWAWLEDANRTLADFRTTYPNQSSTILEVFHEGAYDYLNESRMTLAFSQLLQVEVQARLLGFFPQLPEEQRRNASLVRVTAEEDVSRAAVAAVYERLRALDPGLQRSHAFEYATYAAVVLGIGDDLARDAPNVTRQLATSPAAEERIVRFALLVSMGGQLYARWADALLNLTEQVDRDASRPALPAGALTKIGEAIRLLVDNDVEAGSITGQGSAEARDLLSSALAGRAASEQLARFLAFEQARSNDALDFRSTQGTLASVVLAGNLRLVVDNASWAPHYDGNLVQVPPTQPPLERIGYLGVLQRDARNHALYRLTYDLEPGTEVPTFGGAAAAWGHLVAARYQTEVLQEVPSPPRGPPAGPGDWLLYGGIAVVAALVVVAVAFLRKPGA